MTVLGFCEILAHLSGFSTFRSNIRPQNILCSEVFNQKVKFGIRSCPIPNSRFSLKNIFLFLQTQTILERHLKIGEGLTTDKLMEATKKDGSVTMLRGSPGFRFVQVEEDGGYVKLQWEDLEARVIRPNLKCTNGYIHVIDKVIMKKRDITLSKSSTLLSSISVLTATLLTYLAVQ